MVFIGGFDEKFPFVLCISFCVWRNLNSLKTIIRLTYAWKFIMSIIFRELQVIFREIS